MKSSGGAPACVEANFNQRCVWTRRTTAPSEILAAVGTRGKARLPRREPPQQALRFGSQLPRQFRGGNLPAECGGLPGPHRREVPRA